MGSESEYTMQIVLIGFKLKLTKYKYKILKIIFKESQCPEKCSRCPWDTAVHGLRTADLHLAKSFVHIALVLGKSSRSVWF